MAARSKDDFYKKYGNYSGDFGKDTEDKPVSKRTKSDFFEAYGNDSNTSEDFRMQAAEAYLKNREKNRAQSRAMNFRYNSEPTFRVNYPTALFSEKLYRQAANADKGNNRSVIQTQMDAAKYNALVEKGKKKRNAFIDGRIQQDSVWEAMGTEYLKYATDEEKNKYLYLIGKNEESEADKYLDELSDILKQRQLDNTTEKMTEFSKKYPIGGAAINAVMPIMSGLGYLDDIDATIRGKEFDISSTGHTASAIERATREGVKQAARENIADSSVTDFLVDTGLSMTQSLARLPFGTAGLAIAGASAATQGAEDAVERGATKGQALLSGLAQGAAEAGAEKVSLGSLKSMKQMPVYTAKDIGKNLLKQMGTEASEEMVTEFANTMTDYMIMKDRSNYNRSVSAYIATGASESEAKRLARLDIMKNIGLSGLGGAISGGVMGGGAMALSGIEQSYIGGKSDITNYQEFADTVDTERESYQKEEDYDRAVRLQKLAQEFADREANGEKLSKLEKGAFERDLYEFEMPLFKDAQDREVSSMDDDFIHTVEEQETEDTRTEIEKVADRAIERESEEIAPVQEKAELPERVRKNMEEVAELGDLLGENGKKAFVEQYDNETGIFEYRRAFNRYYDAGRHNIDIDIADRSAMSSILTNDQAIAAYKAGAQDRKLISDALASERFTEGEAKTGSAADLSGRASAVQMNAAETIGRKTGLKIELIGSNENIDGSYAPKSGVIQISVDSDNFLQTSSHELTHFIKDYAGDYYEAYKDVCINALMNSEKISYDEMVERYEQKYLESGSVKSRDEILDEIAADATGKFLNDENFINEVKKEDKGLTQKIIDFISDMIDSIKELISTNKLTKAAEALSDQLDFYENARDMWAYGLEKAGETYKSGKEAMDADTKKFQIKNPNQMTEEQIEKNYQSVREMSVVKTLKGNEFNISDPDIKSKIKKFYSQVGSVEHPVVGTIKLTNRSVNDDFGHGKGPEKVITFAAVPELLRNGYVLDYQKDWKGRGYDTTVIGGKVDISEGKYAGEYYMGAIVNVYPDTNRAYLHEVYATRADSYTPSDQDAINDTTPEAYNYPPINSILHKLRNVNGNNEENRRFQLKDPMEESADLIAVHNITSDKLLKTLQLEGIPMPSIAITKAEIGHENFGDISLLFKKETIDPKKKKNKVYSADAWTPLFPTVEYEMDDSVAGRLKALAYGAQLPEEYSREIKTAVSNLEDYLSRDGSETAIADRLRNKNGMKALYLKEHGEDITERYKTVREEKNRNQMYEDILNMFDEDIETIGKTSLKELYEKYADDIKTVALQNGRTEEQAERLVTKGNTFGFSKTIQRVLNYANKPSYTENTVVDLDRMNQEIESKIDTEKYDKWVDDLVKGIVKSSGITNGKDRFTPSGERRSFKQTHYDLTAKNVVRSMLSDGENGKNVAGFQGIKTIRAEAADEFTSIKDIKENSYRLQNINNETYAKQVDDLENRLSTVIRSIAANNNLTENMMNLDIIGDNIMEASENPTAENIRRTFEKYKKNITEDEVKEIASLIRDIKEMPVNMFEAKPQRVVDYDEIEAAVVPNTVPSEVLDALDRKGIRVIEYDANEEGGRKRAVNSVEGIRFKLKNVDESVDVDSILSENTELKKANEYLEQQLNSTKDYAPGLKDIDKISTKLLKDYSSAYPKERLNENLKKLYNYIKVADQIDGADITKAATAIGRSIIKQSEMKDTAMKEQYQGLLDHVKNTKIVLPERFRSELETVGGYTNFRKHYFGKLRLGNEGVDVDVAYEELSNLYPDMFDSSIVNPADQIMRIAEVVDSVQPQIKNPYHANMDEMAYLAGQEIYNEYFNVRSLEPTRKDKMEGEVYNIRLKYREHMDAYKAKLKTEYEENSSRAYREARDQIQSMREQYNALSKEAITEKKELRSKMNQMREQVTIDRLTEKYKYQRRKENTEARKHKERIIKDVTEMTRWLEKPTDKKHVPEQMRIQIAEFLKGIDFSSDKVRPDGELLNRTKQWHSMQSLFGEIIDKGGLDDGDSSYYMEIDPDIVKKMEGLQGKIADIDKLDNLDIKEIRTLREVVQSMKRCIVDANALYANKSYERIEDVANAFQSDLADRKDKTEYAGFTGQALRMAQIDMLDANTMFTRMGPAAKSVYQELRDGFDQKIRNTKIAQDYMEKLMEDNQITTKDIRAWSGKNAETHEFDIQGQKIKFTTAQIMSLYAQNKREQARGHIYSEIGGIKTAPIVRIDEKTKRYVIDRPSTPVKVTPSDVENITKVLTPEQKNMADGIVKFFTTQTSEWGNEVSMRMYGYKKFMAPNYFPIVTDKNYLVTKNADLENSNTTLRNLGATKSTVYKANNPIIIEDIFDVYTRQTDQMGSYNAFVIPLADMQKWLNFKEKGVGSVKETLDRVFGPDGQDYVKQLLIDVNGSSAGKADITSGLVRNMKAASVGGNLRTAIQQPTAYMRAMMEIDAKYLAEGLTKPCNDWEMAKQYAPIVQWKDWGYYDINTGKSMKNILMGSESTRESLTEKSMWLAGKGDEVTWKRLWEAAKAETRDLHPEFKEGSEEFYTQAGKRLTEIVDNTQVVDSVFHRSQLMRRKDGLTQMYTSFMGEPTKTYNMLYRAVADCAVSKTKKSRKLLGRALLTYTITATTTAAAASFIDAARDDDDEKGYWEKYLEAFGENLVDNMNPLNMVPLLRDIWSVFGGYQVQRTDMQAIQQLYYFTQQVEKYQKGESDLTLPGLVLDSSKTISLLTGVPVNNALRDVNGIVDSLLRGIGATGVIYPKKRATRDIKSTENLNQYIGLAMKAYYKGDKKLGDKIVSDLKDAVDLDAFEKRYINALKSDERTAEAAEAKGSGKMLQYESLAEELASEGFNEDYVFKAIKSTASGFKSSVKKIKGYQEDGKNDKAEELKEDLLEQGFSESYIDESIKNLPEDEEKEDSPETLYTWSDLDLAFDTSTEDFDRVSEYIWENKKEEDWDDNKIISQARSWFTSKYKSLYQYGTDAERLEIRKKLYNLKVKGKKLYESEKVFSDWMDEKKEKERKEREKARRNK